jgi:hypothetical protein
MDTRNLNPDKNLYSVAPVGPTVIIGRISAVKGGIERKRAINLLAWLMIATNATGEEIRAELKDAKTATGQAPAAGTLEPTANLVSIPQSTQEAVRPFIGDIDGEESEALQVAQKA